MSNLANGFILGLSPEHAKGSLLIGFFSLNPNDPPQPCTICECVTVGMRCKLRLIHTYFSVSFTRKNALSDVTPKAKSCRRDPPILAVRVLHSGDIKERRFVHSSVPSSVPPTFSLQQNVLSLRTGGRAGTSQNNGCRSRGLTLRQAISTDARIRHFAVSLTGSASLPFR